MIDPDYTLMFDKNKNFPIYYGAPVIVETSQGETLDGEVVGFEDPITTDESLRGKIAVRVKVRDERNILTEGRTVLVYLQAAGKHKSPISSSASTPEEPSLGPAYPRMDIPLPFFPTSRDKAMLSRRDIMKLVTTAAFAAANVDAFQILVGANPPDLYSSGDEKSSLNLNDVEGKVLKNKLLTAQEASEYIQKRLSEQLPGDKKFSLSAGVYRAGNGQVSYATGIQGALNNVAGAIFQGNAINPTQLGLDLLLSFTGKIMDAF